MCGGVMGRNIGSTASPSPPPPCFYASIYITRILVHENKGRYLAWNQILHSGLIFIPILHFYEYFVLNCNKNKNRYPNILFTYDFESFIEEAILPGKKLKPGHLWDSILVFSWRKLQYGTINLPGHEIVCLQAYLSIYLRFIYHYGKLRIFLRNKLACSTQRDSR